MIINPFTKEIRVLTDEDRQFQRKKHAERIELIELINQEKKAIEESKESKEVVKNVNPKDLKVVNDADVVNYEDTKDDFEEKMQLLQTQISNIMITHNLNPSPAS